MNLWKGWTISRAFLAYFEFWLPLKYLILTHTHKHTHMHMHIYTQIWVTDSLNATLCIQMWFLPTCRHHRELSQLGRCFTSSRFFLSLVESTMQVPYPGRRGHIASLNGGATQAKSRAWPVCPWAGALSHTAVQQGQALYLFCVWSLQLVPALRPYLCLERICPGRNEL